MRKINQSATLAILSMAMGFASCNDDLINEQNGISDIDLKEVNDLTLGNNSMIWNVDSLDSYSIPLAANLPVEIKSKGGKLSLRQDTDEKGNAVLRPVILTDIDQPVMMDFVTLSYAGHPELSKTVALNVRNYNTRPGVRAETITDYDKEIQERAMQVFGYGINPMKGMKNGLTGGEILDLNIIRNKSEYVRVSTVTALTTDVFMVEENSHEINKNSESWKFGLKFPIPIGHFLTALGFDGGHQEDESHQTEKEYVLGGVSSDMADCWLDDAILAGDTIGWVRYISPSLNDALNQPKSALYKQYPENDIEAACKLIEHYGMYMVTECKLGGRATYKYERTCTVSEKSVGWDLDASVDIILKDTLSGTMSADDIKKAELIKNIRGTSPADKASATVAYGSKAYEYLKQDNRKMEIKLEGGMSATTKDYKEWTVTNKPQNWILTSYKSGRGTSTMSTFVPLTDFLTEATPAGRANPIREAMKEYTRKDGTKSCAFYDYMEHNKGTNVADLVLADLIMVHYVNTKNKNALKWEPKFLEGPDHKWRMYYPMNKNYREVNKQPAYTAVNTLNWVNFAFREYERHYWYYALDYSWNTNGITDVKISESAMPFYESRGASAKDYISPVSCLWRPLDNHIWIKAGSSKTTDEEKIKAVALVLAPRGQDRISKGSIISSTPFTDMIYNNEESYDGMMKYWQDSMSQLPSCNDWIGFQYKEAESMEPYSLFLISSKKPLFDTNSENYNHLVRPEAFKLHVPSRD